MAAEYDVSRQAIEQKAKIQGWRPAQALSNLEASMATLEPALALRASDKDKYGMRTIENATRAAELAEKGATYSVIAARLGLTIPALKA